MTKEHRNLTVAIVLIVAVAAVLGQILWFQDTYKRNMATLITHMTKIEGGLDWSQMEEQERKSKYRKMMIRILTVYGFQYDPKFKKAMSNDEKIQYINFNYEAASKLNFGLFDVPIIHQMETAFNPHARGEFNEIGIGQMKFGTALLAEKLLKFMPDSLRKFLSFDLKSQDDLFNPIVNAKAAYVLLWHLRREYQNREDWYISIYHWGGFLGQRWDEGKGEVPLSFTLNGIEYNVIKYYLQFRELKDAYEAGQLEAGKEIEEKWKNYQAQLTKEEINFRKTKSIIRNLKKQLTEKRELESELEKKHEEITKALNQANEQLNIIANGAQKDGPASLKKVKDVVKNLLSLIKSSK